MNYTGNSNWGTIKKFLFRFACLYILLYTLPAPYTYIPGVSFIGQHIDSFWNSLGLWFGESALSIGGDINTDPNGSGDRTIDYLRLVVLWIISFAGTLLWTVIDFKRKNYNRLVYWIRLHVRYYLFATLFFYGIVKVIKTQFPFPSLVQLIQPLGDTSPMGLAWTFMGYSETYTMFAGLMEILGALFLLFRKTTTFGALITVGVMSNVVLMNFSYDIPVKLFSLHLVGFALFLLSFDIKRILNLFIFNNPTPSVLYRRIFKGKRSRHLVSVIKILFVGYVMFSSTSRSLDRYQEVGPDREKPPLYGLYEVDSFILNGNEIPPLTTNTVRWKYFILDRPGRATVKRMNDTFDSYSIEIDTTQQQLILSKSADSSSFHYQKQNSQLTVKGVLKGDSLSMTMKDYDLSNFQLIGRKFNWINEYPYNR